jgi:hypothetical protein
VDNEADVLAEQACGFDIGGPNFHIRKKLMQSDRFGARLLKPANSDSGTV